MGGKTVVVIGLGRFGRRFARTASDLGHDVIAIDINEKNVDAVREYTSVQTVGDIRKNGATLLRKIGADGADVGVVAIGTDISASAIATLDLQDIGVSTIVAKASDEEHIRILEKLGVDNIISPEKDAGLAMAYVKLLGSDVQIHDLQGTYIDMFILEVTAPDRLVGKAIRNSRLREDFGMTLVSIRRDGELIVIPSPDEVIQEGDRLLLASSSQSIDKFVRTFLKLDLSGKVLSIGAGRFGANFIKKAYELGYSVVAVDSDPEKIERIKNYTTMAATMDILANDAKIGLKQLLGGKVPRLSSIATGDDLSASIVGYLECAELGSIDFVVKAVNPPHTKALMKLGLTYQMEKTAKKQIVLPEEEAGVSSAYQVLEGMVLGLTGVYLMILKAPQSLVGKTIRNSSLREHHKITLVGIIRGFQFIPVPSPDEVIKEGDRLLLMGSREALDAYKASLGQG